MGEAADVLALFMPLIPEELSDEQAVRVNAVATARVVVKSVRVVFMMLASVLTVEGIWVVAPGGRNTVSYSRRCSGNIQITFDGSIEP